MVNQLEMARAILSTTAARWLSLIESVPNDLLTRTPDPNK